jgi:hypothetical protein
MRDNNTSGQWPVASGHTPRLKTQDLRTQTQISKPHAPRPSSLIPHLSSLIILFFWPTILEAQVVRLPPVEDQQQQRESTPDLLAMRPDSSSEILQAPGEESMAPPSPSPHRPTIPPGTRDGVFQKALFDYTFLGAGGTRGLGMNDIHLQLIFAAPCPRRDTPLVITPGIAVHYLEPPAGVPLPPRLAEYYMQCRWMAQVNPKLGLDLAVTPGMFSDFKSDNDDQAFRLTGHAAGAWTCNDSLKLVLGAAYLDRPDIDVIPVGGLVWTPSEDWKFDLVFPHPRISRRLLSCQADIMSNAKPTEDWLYLAGEFLGDAWAIERPGGNNELVVLSDYRLVLGVERKVVGGLSSRVEVGYVFGRRIRFTGATPDFDPTDTVMVRGGISY